MILGPPPLLFADGRLVILDKPAGLPAHSARAGGTSAEDWFPQLSRRREGPWLAHRLDTDTSGCLAVALRKSVLVRLQALFASGAVEKTYWAVVQGDPPAEHGRIENRLSRVARGKAWRMEVRPDGLPAVTDWRVLGSGGGRTWLELRPRTGRTHQIRVHCAVLGCPILGDPIYAGAAHNTGGLHLLARRLVLPLDPPAEATAPPPGFLAAQLRTWGRIDTARTCP